MTHPRRRGVAQSPYGPHEALVGAIPTGPAPANPTRQRLGTTLACTCGADWGLVSELPRHDGGRRAAMRRYAEHTELAALRRRAPGAVHGGPVARRVVDVVTAPSRQPGQGPDPLVSRIAAELVDVPRGPIDPDREPLLAELLVEEGTHS